VELAFGIGFPPLLGNNTKLSSILQRCQDPKGTGMQEADQNQPAN
jgi:hypothetical protein